MGWKNEIKHATPKQLEKRVKKYLKSAYGDKFRIIDYKASAIMDSSNKSYAFNVENLRTNENGKIVIEDGVKSIVKIDSFLKEHISNLLFQELRNVVHNAKISMELYVRINYPTATPNQAKYTTLQEFIDDKNCTLNIWTASVFLFDESASGDKAAEIDDFLREHSVFNLLGLNNCFFVAKKEDKKRLDGFSAIYGFQNEKRFEFSDKMIDGISVLKKSKQKPTTISQTVSTDMNGAYWTMKNAKEGKGGNFVVRNFKVSEHPYGSYGKWNAKNHKWYIDK